MRRIAMSGPSWKHYLRRDIPRCAAHDAAVQTRPVEIMEAQRVQAEDEVAVAQVVTAVCRHLLQGWQHLVHLTSQS